MDEENWRNPENPSDWRETDWYSPTPLEQEGQAEVEPHRARKIRTEEEIEEMRERIREADQRRYGRLRGWTTNKGNAQAPYSGGWCAGVGSGVGV